MMTRRQAIKTTALASAALATLPGAIAQTNFPAPAAAPSGLFTLPPLPYAYDALEPFIDAETMHIHHDKHHAAYVANLNKAVSQVQWGAEITPVENLLRNNLIAVPESIRTAIRNNGGGHYNHSLFWQMMKKDGGGEPSGDLAKAIDDSFGSFSAFKEQFTKAALGQFGSGWAWLIIPTDEQSKLLSIMPTANQDTFLSMAIKGPVTGPPGDVIQTPDVVRHFSPLLGIDVWEHAYYLKYQNKRADYIAAWFSVVNWDFVSERYAKSMA